MGVHDQVSTGLAGLNRMIDMLRLGDNVVWKVDSMEDYKKLVGRYIEQALQDKRNIIYIRFGIHAPLIDAAMPVKKYELQAEKGFENFAAEVYGIVENEGKRAFYVFDCLTDLLQYWHSDVMVGNFFRIICPFLYELDTVAYFAIMRNVHTFATIARIRETTQLLLELFRIGDKVYIHPLKVWQRYSPTMFLPHLMQGDEMVSITSSAQAAGLFSKLLSSEKRMDYWNVILGKAKDALSASPQEQQEAKQRLMRILFGDTPRMFALCDRYFTLKDILDIAGREIGTGFIGGKSVGMLIARKVLETEGAGRFSASMEAHDSFYIGSDVFYTYIVQNGWWKLRTKQKSCMDMACAQELKEKILQGSFPEDIQRQFMHMLDYFGQSPIIVRSSSLLEDNFGNAFSGKYESVFCVNQGTPEDRFDAFIQAVRTVYASTMSEDALSYRMNRGLADEDEQMAILVQRVSGDYYGDYFFPHIAGVGNSTNLYVWDQKIDMSAGMIRLVFGLGTRAVDRTTSDYVRIVCLDDPMRLPPMDYTDAGKYSQHGVDLLSIKENAFTERPFEQVFAQDIKANKALFLRPDISKMSRLRDLGYSAQQAYDLLDFKQLLSGTEFTALMKDMLALLSRVYDYPVDIEFTANFTPLGDFKLNLLQCRPLQTRGLGSSVELPQVLDASDCYFATRGNFMGGNVHLPVDYVVSVSTARYMDLTEQEKYAVARQIGRVNAALKGKRVMLIGPGRWGTTTPSIGVPVRFSEICNMSVICEVAEESVGFVPELSYGSHFFQDLVEMEIFYVAIFAEHGNVLYNPSYVLQYPNFFGELCPDSPAMDGVITVCKPEGLEIFSDVKSQRVVCR